MFFAYHRHVIARYDKIARLTLRWALPAAAIILPGGFVLWAAGWCYKRVRARPVVTPVPPPTANPIASPGFMAIVRANLKSARAETSCAGIRHGTLRRIPVRATPGATEPAVTTVQ